jgi:N-methylhydantoinase B
MPNLDPVSTEILWARLISIVDEAALALQRTSFSTTVRDSNDFAFSLLDTRGNSLADNTLGVPSFAGMMSLVVKAILASHPVSSWRHGDAIVTNDPWLSTGHLPDTTVICPIFHAERLVAFSASSAHKADIGGAGYAADVSEVFEEGLRIPPMKLYRRGKRNKDVYEIIGANVRVPELVLGDLEAQVAAAHFCGIRIGELLADLGLNDLTDFGHDIIDRTRQAMQAAISSLPDGVYRDGIDADGFESPVQIRLAIVVRGSTLLLDFRGTSPQVSRGINVVYNYTYAFACYAVKCLLDPQTPKNSGSYSQLSLIVPEGSILNCTFPAAVNGRSLTGHYVSLAVMRALSPVLQDRVLADCGSCPGLRAVFYGINRHDRKFTQMLFYNGGMGAMQEKDGLSCTGFPTNAGGPSVELLESVAPLMVRRRELIPDSGGPGRWRGGCGQVVEIEVLSQHPVRLWTQFDRIKHAAAGLLGAGAGAPASLTLNYGSSLPAKGQVVLATGDVVTLRYAGGGGFGPPGERSRALVAEDIANGLVSWQAAIRHYGYEAGSEA